MIGVTPHKQTGIYWLRRKTPKHLVERREELEAMGIEFKKEFLRTLGTRDPRQAALVYPEKLREIEDIWLNWEQALSGGPTKLSYKETVALAGEYAKRFFDENEHEPFDVPEEPPIPMSSLPDGPWKQWPVTERQELGDALAALKACDDERERSVLAFKLLAENPRWGQMIAPALAEVLWRTHGADVTSILHEKQLNVDNASRVLLSLEVLYRLGRARAGLQQRRDDDWSEVVGLHGLPAYEPPESGEEQEQRPASSHHLLVTFEQVIAEQQRLSALRLAKHYRSPRTFDKYRQDCALFERWRGVADLTTVTLREAVRWRDEMLGECEAGKLRRKTVIVRRQDNWRNWRRELAEERPRLLVDVRRQLCGAASADVRWSVV